MKIKKVMFIGATVVCGSSLFGHHVYLFLCTYNHETTKLAKSSNKTSQDKLSKA